MFGTFQCKMVETDLHKGLKEEKRKTEGIQSILYFLHNSYFLKGFVIMLADLFQ